MGKNVRLQGKVGIIGLSTNEVNFVSFSVWILGILATKDKPYLNWDLNLLSVY